MISVTVGNQSVVSKLSRLGSSKEDHQSVLTVHVAIALQFSVPQGKLPDEQLNDLTGYHPITRKKPAACSKVLAPKRVTFATQHDFENTMLITIMTMLSAIVRFKPETRANNAPGRVHIDTNGVYAVLDHRLK